MESDESPYTREELRKWMAISAEEKLLWLEEASEFLDSAVTGERREIMNKFRRGELGDTRENNSHSD